MGVEKESKKTKKGTRRIERVKRTRMMWQLKTKALSTLAVVVLRLKQDFRPHPRASSPTLHAPPNLTKT